MRKCRKSEESSEETNFPLAAKTGCRLYADRIAYRYCHHCPARGPAFSRIRQGARVGTGKRLPDETHALKGCVQNMPYPVGSLETSRLNWRRSVQPYLKNTFVMRCPSNTYTEFNFPPGDITNQYYAPKDYLPLSYAYNGAFFHEAVPACWYGEKLERPRTLSEISRSANLILVLESRSPCRILAVGCSHSVTTAGRARFNRTTV